MGGPGQSTTFVVITPRSHNPKVGGSNPPPATQEPQGGAGPWDRPFCCAEIYPTLNPTNGNTVALSVGRSAS